MNEYREHECTEKCVCHIHNTQMFYSKREKLHACQDPSCVFAHGYENHRWNDPNHDVMGDIKSFMSKAKEVHYGTKSADSQ